MGEEGERGPENAEATRGGRKKGNKACFKVLLGM